MLARFESKCKHFKSVERRSTSVARQRINKLYFATVLNQKTRKLNPQENTGLSPARSISKTSVAPSQLFTKKNC